MGDPDDANLFEREAGEDEDDYVRRKPSKDRKFADSSEEEDDEDQDQFEKDGFIVDGDDEEESEGSRQTDDDDGGRRHTSKKVKRKRRRKDLDLVDDDDELHEDEIKMLKESGVDVDSKRRKKLHRLKKHASVDEEVEDDLRNLGDDEPGLDDDDREREAVDEDVDDVEDDDDFIDDGGRSRRRLKKSGTTGVSSDAVRAARNVFGDFSMIREEYKAAPSSRRAGRVGIQRSGDADDDDVTDPVDELELGGRLRSRRNRDGSGSESDGNDGDGSDVGSNEDDESGSDMSNRRRRSSRSGRRLKADALKDAFPEDVAVTAAVTARLSLGSGIHLSTDDTAVIETDIPERLQVHVGSRKNVSKEELSREAVWIYEHAFATNPEYVACLRAENVVKKIGIVLNYIHNEKLDIPFIAQYRKDYVAPELLYPCGAKPWPGGDKEQVPLPKGFNAVNYTDFDDAFSIEHLRGVPPGHDDGFGDWTPLWVVLDFDKKWAEIEAQRADVTRLVESCRFKGVPASITEKACELTKESSDAHELRDVERHIRLATEAAVALSGRDDVDGLNRVDMTAMTEEQTRVASRRRRPNSRANRYGEFHRKGYGLLAAKFGITANELADNFEGALQYGERYQECVPRDAEADPEIMACMVQKDLEDSLVGNQDSGEGDSLIEADPKKLLASARYLLAREILADPRVLRTARKTLGMEDAMVSTEVSESGMVAVDGTHPLRAYVHVKDKPVRALMRTPDFALMKKAAEKGYCTIGIRFQDEREQQLLRGLESAGTVVELPSMSASVKAWNEERLVLAKQVCEGLLEQLKAEAKEKLELATEECLHERLCHAASRRLLLGPSRPFPNETGAPRVMAITVTREADEEPDPAQISRDNEIAKEKKSGVRPYRRPAGPRCTFVNLDNNGAFLNSEEVFGRWLERRAEEKVPPEPLMRRIQAFLAKSKPQVIVIGLGSGGREAVRLRGDLMEILADMVHKGSLGFLVGEDEAKAMAKGGPLRPPYWDEATHQSVEDSRWRTLENHVVSVPDDVARLHAISNAANVALPIDGMTLLEKRAIALGRFAQYPLSVYAGIAVENDMAARLELHRLHYMAKPEGRIEALRRALARAVCIAGVDINRVLIVPHLQAMLPFVGGLGPRKAGALVRKIEVTLGDADEGTEALPSRKHLIARQYMNRTVFMSAAGFLRVRDPALHAGGSTTKAIEERRRQIARTRLESRGRRGRGEDDALTFFDPLDDSRIHPENYRVAVKIADEALRDEGGELRADLIDANANNISSLVIAVVLDHPDGLTQLDLELYASHLESNGSGRLFQTISIVTDEFQAPFKDNRAPLRTPDARAEFYLATGADPFELRLGGELTATQCMVSRSQMGISCRLPHGLRGYLTLANYSDNNPSGADMAAVVSNGSDLRCRVIGFNYEAFDVALASKTSVMREPAAHIQGYQPSFDEKNQYILAYPRRARGPVSREGRSGVRASRLKNRAQGVVNHDFFHDVTAVAAADNLRNATVGEVIIRPSGSGVDQFVFTAKFADASRFSDKDSERGMFHLRFRVANATGPEANIRYIIGNEEFGSVEEMLERHVMRVLVNMGEAMESRKFKSLKENDLKSFVDGEKKLKPKTRPYFFGISDTKPLTLNIYYVPGKSTVAVESIKVVPDGFQFRRVLHTSLDLLADWFKKNMDIVPKSRAPNNKGVASPFVAGSSAAGLGSSVARPLPRPVATPLRDEAPPQLPRLRPMAASQVAGAYPVTAPPPPPRPVSQPPPPPVTNPVPYLVRQNPVVAAPASYAHGMPYGAPPQPMHGYAPQAAGDWGPPPPPNVYALSTGQVTAPNMGFHPQPYSAPPLPVQRAGQYPPAAQLGGPQPPPPSRRPADEAGARRGQMPIPAWKKAQQGGKE
jgi:transcription elongation factor SPT6